MKKIFQKLNSNLRLAIIILAVVVLWMLTGLFKTEESKTKRQELPVSSVTIKKVMPSHYTPEVSVVGSTAVAADVDLVSEVSGKVESINFEQGDYVQAGDLMLTLENNYRNDNLNSAKEELKAAELKLDIAKRLEKQAYKAKTDLADRQAEYTRALSNLTDAKRDYENSFVKTPISGFVEEKNVSLGDYVKEDTVLYKIISQDKMYLVGYLSQSQISKIKLGAKAYGVFNSGKKVEGVVTFIAQKAEPATKTYKFEVTVMKNSSDFRVREGLTVQIKIPSETIDVYTIPHSSMVIADDGRVGVRLVDDKASVKFKEIKLIKDTNDNLLVQVGSLNKEINLIIRGQVDVKTGMTVNYKESNEVNENNKGKEND